MMLIGVHWFAMYSQNSKVRTVSMEMVFWYIFSHQRKKFTLEIQISYNKKREILGIIISHKNLNEKEWTYNTLGNSLIFPQQMILKNLKWWQWK